MSAARVEKPRAATAALVVDDDLDMCRVLEIALAGVGCVATTVSSAKRAIDVAAGHRFPVAFVDARLPDMDGWQLIEELRRINPAIRVVMISGYYFGDDVAIAEALRRSRIQGFLAKPFQIEAILSVARALA